MWLGSVILVEVCSSSNCLSIPLVPSRVMFNIPLKLMAHARSLVSIWSSSRMVSEVDGSTKRALTLKCM